MTATCPLCETQNTGFYYRDIRREYWQCECCALVFLLPGFYLDVAAEKQQYDLHENADGDEGYRRFLNRIAEPLLLRLPMNASGLDFGCGPAPVLANILQQAGHEVLLYDIFYNRNDAIWQRDFDFITATEVFEHLHFPGKEWSRLWARLRPNGYLAIMTKLVIDVEAFSRWHYKNDPTHVCFFSRTTFLWWAGQNNAQIEFIGNDVILLRKMDA